MLHVVSVVKNPHVLKFIENYKRWYDVVFEILAQLNSLLVDLALQNAFYSSFQKETRNPSANLN